MVPRNGHRKGLAQIQDFLYWTCEFKGLASRLG